MWGEGGWAENTGQLRVGLANAHSRSAGKIARPRQAKESLGSVSQPAAFETQSKRAYRVLLAAFQLSQRCAPRGVGCRARSPRRGRSARRPSLRRCPSRACLPQIGTMTTRRPSRPRRGQSHAPGKGGGLHHPLEVGVGSSWIGSGRADHRCSAFQLGLPRHLAPLSAGSQSVL